MQLNTIFRTLEVSGKVSMEEVIDTLIKERGLSRRQFAESISIPPTTLQSILTRGVDNASINNVLKICKGLGITAEELQRMADGEEVAREVWTADELREIEQFKEFVRSRKGKGNKN